MEGGTSILKQFSLTPKESVFKKMEDITIGFRDKDVNDWGEMLDTTEWTSNGFTSFGFFTIVFAMLLPWWIN